MNINRHNYEEYFILYLDNELSSDDRRMVEDFAEKNPDLKEDLDILLQSKLVPNNHITFAAKDELMRSTESTPIHSSNYEEWLLLYTDNELSKQQQEEVEKFVETTPLAKTDLELLQKAKLQPEEIIFPYKESLYRRAERVPVVSIRWWRIAAAAVLVLAMGITAITLVNNNSTNEKETGITLKSGPGEIENSTLTNITTDQQEPKNDSKKENENPEINSLAKKESDQKNSTPNPTKKFEIANNKSEDGNNNAIANNQPPTNNLPVPEYTADRQRNLDAVTDVINNEKSQTSTNKPEFAVTTGFTKPYINTVATGYSDETESDESKSKLRGLLRKATRFFERRTNIDATDDDDRLLIGGLAVKLK